MTLPLKTENGVSSCGGLLVRPIIGRFCGNFTSGRSPLSNGSAAVAANARKEGNVIPAPSAAMAAPEFLKRVRRSIIAFLPFRLLAAHDDPRRLHAPAVGSLGLHQRSSGSQRPMRACRGSLGRSGFLYDLTFLL